MHARSLVFALKNDANAVALKPGGSFGALAKSEGWEIVTSDSGKLATPFGDPGLFVHPNISGKLQVRTGDQGARLTLLEYLTLEGHVDSIPPPPVDEGAEAAAYWADLAASEREHERQALAALDEHAEAWQFAGDD